MNLLITLIFAFLTNQFPSIISNTSEQEKSQSIIYNLFSANKHFLVAYTNESYWWSDKKYYQVLAYENNKWEKLTIRSRRYKNGQWSKPKVSRTSIDSKVANDLLANLSKQSFWSLENDVLNNTKVQNEDGTVTKHSLSDGVNYRFEILSGDHFRIIEAYEPDYYLNVITKSAERVLFIKCRNEFEQVLKQ